MNTKFSFRKYILLLTVLGLPQWLSGKESTGNEGDIGFDLPGGEGPLEKEPTPVCLPVKSYGQKRLAGYSPWDQKRVRYI